ncbi:twin-arginine translocase subunit TatC [Proteinivorax hydrogeniformans]|uniref:Sec-independent protein translocase protein TatC n=1 Tax=Proteinivorax hydrogeniformans TaxID=1826727 RepID=A0AAU8HS54_9FIRM
MTTKLTLIDHFAELRKRLIIIFISTIGAAALTYMHIDPIIGILLKPADNIEFIYVSPPELLLTYIRVSIILGVFFASPIILFQLWLFLSPALKKKEQRYLLLALFVGILLFIVGAVFAYFIIIPLTLDFFVRLSAGQIDAMFSIANYISFIKSLILAFALVFQLPLIIVLLSQLGLVTAKSLRKFRRYFLLIIIIVAALITPPDIISQFLMAGPMIVLYEISILISALIDRRRKKKRKKK